MADPVVTEDALLGGRVRLLQPAQGYRVAIDPVLLAAVLPDGFRGRVADLGCGVGAAALCAATRLTEARVVGIERDPFLADLARQNVARNGLDARAEIVTGDIRGAASPDFEAVIVNPGEILLQERRGACVRLPDCRAEIRAGAAKELESRATVLPRMEPVDFAGDVENGQPVGVIQRHGIAQDRQMPREQRTAKPLHPVKA